MSESSSTDAAALRREARRRRILENSQSRLRSITGRIDSSSFDEEPKAETCFRIHSDQFRNANQNDIFRELSLTTSMTPDISKDCTAVGGTFDRSIDEDIKVKTHSQIKRSYFESLVQKRYHYVILSVVVRILLLCQLGFLFYNNVICPFVTVKLMECMLIQDTAMIQKPNFLSLLASVSKGSIIPHMCKAYSIIRMVVSDFFLYMFTFILSDKLFNAVQESYLT